MNIIFLDMDGVLNNGNEFDIDGNVISRTNMHHFMQVIRHVPDARIVVVSSWRAMGRQEYMRTVLEGSPEHGREFLSYLHQDWSAPLRMSSTKGMDVESWLARNGKGVEKHLCVDDEPAHYLEGQPLLCTADEYGFGLRERQLLISYFANAECHVGTRQIREALDRQEAFLEQARSGDRHAILHS